VLVFRVSFYSRYQLERLLADGPAKTFQAVENATGRPVYLHLFSPESRLLFDTIAARFRDSAGALQLPLIETGEFAGSLYAVTEVIEPFKNLPAWAESVAPGFAAAPVPPPVQERPVAGAATKEPGEFTRMFAAQQSNAPPAAPSPPPAEEKEPGAFTREFMVKAPAPQPAWPPKAPVPPKPEPPKPVEKQMWPEQKPGRSDDISDLFKSSIPGEQVDVEAEQARAARAAPPVEKPFRRAGTFTRMFGPHSPRKQERTQTPSFLFDSGFAAPVESKPVESKKEPTIERGPGEYTRMVAVPQQTEAQQPVQPAAPPAVLAAAPPANRVLVIAFILIGVLTIAVIVLAALLYSKR
jgi:hypothetical protein